MIILGKGCIVDFNKIDAIYIFDERRYFNDDGEELYVIPKESSNYTKKDVYKIVAGINSENYELAEFDSMEEAEAELKNIYNALAQNCDYYKV
jgi:hypothetical protein